MGRRINKQAQPPPHRRWPPCCLSSRSSSSLFPFFPPPPQVLLTSFSFFLSFIYYLTSKHCSAGFVLILLCVCSNADMRRSADGCLLVCRVVRRKEMCLGERQRRIKWWWSGVPVQDFAGHGRSDIGLDRDRRVREELWCRS